MSNVKDRLYKQLELLSQHKDFNESCTILDIYDAIKEITRLNAIIKENDADKWISVEDRLPDEKRKVIVYVDRLNYYPNYISTSFRQDGTWREESGNYHNITHWQPLPQPPAMRVKGE